MDAVVDVEVVIWVDCGLRETVVCALVVRVVR